VGRITIIIAAVAGCIVAGAADYPSADITNGAVRAKVWLPDPENGYYRATRFDWAGVIGSLEFRGNNYFAPWKEGHDPKDHEAVSGPVEEFLTDEAWAGAKPGDNVLKIGVGIIRKPEAAKYEFFKTYDIVNPGKWAVKTAPDQVEFTQTVADDASGYGYEYHKTVRLAKDAPNLILEHTLKNSGARAIDTRVYDHNFFVIDDQPSGPDFTVRFAFPLTPIDPNLKGIAQVRGDEVAYLRVLKPDEWVETRLSGFYDTPKDYNIRIENSKVGAGVRITADQPLVDINFWSPRTAVCPEPLIKFHIEPGAEAKWRITYHFYTLPLTRRD